MRGGCDWSLDVCFFFFRAEDGIRGGHVTEVQTCALPIFSSFFFFSFRVLLAFSWSCHPKSAFLGSDRKSVV